jgi:glycosyltransferase involved in cell wall biosynthesis
VLFRSLAQTYSNIEILVINDGSTDGGATHEIAMSYGDQIRYFQKENGGVVSALNFGIENMRGEYFAWLSHDDIYQPKKIERQVSALKKYNGERPAFCVCNCMFIDENGRELYRSFVQEDCEFDKPACFLFLGNVGLNGLMVLIPKSLFDRCGLFTPSLATHEYDMWLRIMAVADVVVEPDCLAYMRIHTQQLSYQKKQIALKEIDRYMGDGIRDIPDDVFQSYVLRRFDAQGIGYLFDLLKSFIWYQHLPYTATQALLQIRRMFGKPSTLADDFYAQLFGPSDLGAAEEYVSYRWQNDKPLVVIYCENITDEVLKDISTGLAIVSADCDIVLLYHAIDEEKLKLLKAIPVKAFQYVNKGDGNLPVYISLLSYLLNAKLFWCIHSGSGMQCAVVFLFLRFMEIGVLSSYHDFEATLANKQDACTSGLDNPDKLLSGPVLVTSCIPPQALEVYGLQNMIVIPEDNLAALVRWKKIFGVLLGTKAYHSLENKIEKRLSDILENTKISLTEYVGGYVKDFIAEVDQRTAAQICYYEQRTFWKLTKPLRFGAWFFRKAQKAIKRVLNREETIGTMLSRIPMALKNRRTSV